MHKLEELKDKLIEELEAYSENGKYSKDDVEAIKYMASAVDHICNIMDWDDYSNAMYGRRYPANSYRDGYSREGYSRARRRDSMGRYSRRGYSMADESMIAELRDLMQDAPDENIKREFEKFIKKVEAM